MNKYFILLICCVNTIACMNFPEQHLQYQEAIAAQEVSRLEAFMAANFTCDQNGIVSYEHFVTRAKRAGHSTLNILHTQQQHPPYQEHFSTMRNYLSILTGILDQRMTREKYIADPYAYEQIIAKKVDAITTQDADASELYTASINICKNISAQDLAQIAALDYYGFIHYIDLEDRDGKYIQEYPVIQRAALIQACAQQSTDQIRNLLEQQRKLPFKGYGHHSTCQIIEQWIENDRRDFNCP